MFCHPTFSLWSVLAVCVIVEARSAILAVCSSTKFANPVFTAGPIMCQLWRWGYLGQVLNFYGTPHMGKPHLIFSKCKTQLKVRLFFNFFYWAQSFIIPAYQISNSFVRVSKHLKEMPLTITGHVEKTFKLQGLAVDIKCLRVQTNNCDTNFHL